MKKIMYLQHVPWSWIKQRPHFLAEALSDDFEVDVYYKKGYINKVDNHTNKVKLMEFFSLPFSRYQTILKINNWLMSKHLSRKIKKYDIIWICDPRTYTFIAQYITENQVLVFDCMDDLAEFPSVKNDPNIYMQQEKKLLDRCNYVLVSSNFLGDILQSRHGHVYKEKISVINNAISTEKIMEFNKILPMEKNDIRADKRKIITYIGTISSWFDFSIILKSLEIEENIVYYLYGPKDITIPNHERIIYKGILEHGQVFSAMEQSDMLVMPFQLTKLVLSVDPVKLYEYIFSNKPIAAIRYGETEKFKDYVYLYTDTEQYLDIINRLVKNTLFPPKATAEIQSFLLNNTWNHRMKEIVSLLKMEE
ncbi:hypothetical protein EV210_10916 [Anaerospora hongkongensis]|uniref:Glycosyltransferase involved in cell wall biosynthesis n=1 Tax=Anaerospora hongkongensis TaxID=244830 RepID=A0A4R1PV98_9FIRM|nr:hypothetical protein [Anaerospora hongkongensis]TCL36067.1 hypothetical protein EV210_10916 [Anaerospora hongkongensis]